MPYSPAIARSSPRSQRPFASYPWTVVRAEYMAALEVASIEGDIGPFVAVLRGEMQAGGQEGG